MTTEPPVAQHACRSLYFHSVAIYALALARVGGVAGWAATTELSNAVVAAGVVAVEGNTKSVQHLSGGIVGQILVAEGQDVKARQLLVRLDGTVVRSILKSPGFVCASVRPARTPPRRALRLDDLGTRPRSNAHRFSRSFRW